MFLCHMVEISTIRHKCTMRSGGLKIIPRHVLNSNGDHWQMVDAVYHMLSTICLLSAYHLSLDCLPFVNVYLPCVNTWLSIFFIVYGLKKDINEYSYLSFCPPGQNWIFNPVITLSLWVLLGWNFGCNFMRSLLNCSLKFRVTDWSWL